MTQNNLGAVLDGSWANGVSGEQGAIFRAVGGRLSGSLGSENARTIAAGLGDHTGQSGHRARWILASG